MALTSSQRQTLINDWRKPSSNTEKDRQDRAERMVKDSISSHPAFSTMNYRIYAKGSYANNTNVKLDSDVDIVMECQNLFYFDYADPQPVPMPMNNTYTGIWTPNYFRQEVGKALGNYFGVTEVIEGSVAFTIREKAGSRPSIDLVPAFQYKYYVTADRQKFHAGNKIFNKSNTAIKNWPEQQLLNGNLKNTQTGYRYKDFVRVLKRAENELVLEGKLSPIPSYLMECLIWNVPNAILNNKNLEADFRETLFWVWNHLTDSYVREEWLEPNERKYLFGGYQKWTVDDAKSIIKASWNLLEYGNA